MLSVLKLRLLRLRDEFWVYVIMMAMSFGFTMVFGYSFNDYKPYVLIVDEDKPGIQGICRRELSGFGGFSFAGPTGKTRRRWSVKERFFGLL
jgi:ABC-2 type transport system permease protein